MMKLATLRTSTGTRAIRIDSDTAAETGHTDVGYLALRPSHLVAHETGPRTLGNRGLKHNRSCCIASEVARPRYR